MDAALSATDFFSPYTRGIFLGVIDSVAGTFSTDCKAGLTGTVVSAWDAVAYKNFLVPSNTIKLQLAVNNLIAASNSIIAFCTFNQLANQFTYLLDY
jgi:hypothetical protein